MNDVILTDIANNGEYILFSKNPEINARYTNTINNIEKK